MASDVTRKITTPSIGATRAEADVDHAAMRCLRPEA